MTDGGAASKALVEVLGALHRPGIVVTFDQDASAFTVFMADAALDPLAQRTVL